MAMIEMYNVSKVYRNGVRALENINIKIDSGEFMFLVGPSGAGKTTLLRHIYREELPTEGQIIIDGRNVERMHESKVPYLRRSIGVVFQDFKLINSKTVFDNVAFALRVIGLHGPAVEKQTVKALESVGLLHKRRMYPEQMSGGEQQRVCIARAIVNDPAIILTDEPTGNLDPDISWEIMKTLLEINMKGTTVLIATHDKAIVDRMQKRVVALVDGRIMRDQRRGGYGYEPY